MSEQTLDQISKLIRELMLEDAPRNLINKTYGLYDGYLYDGLQQQLDAFFSTRNHEMVYYVAEIFDKVNQYPPLTYGDESPEEVHRMMAAINF